MTNEEAIERINEHIAIHRYNEPQAIRIAEALQMAISALEKQDAPEANVGDTISRAAAIDTLYHVDEYNGRSIEAIRNLPSVQPELTDDRAIEHLQSTGWMQNHDREMYESGLREQLADDSGSYDSLIPCEDAISRQAAIDKLDPLFESLAIDKIKALPSAQTERETGKWIDTDNYYMRWKCSLCGCHTREARPDFCPYCGAKMEVEE